MNTGKAAYAAYGLMGLPLAMVALPVYVQIPHYYTSQLGASLEGTGVVLFAARLLDTCQDPWLGRVIDRQTRLTRWLVLAAMLMVLAFAGLWLPQVSGAALVGWLGVMLALVYTAHSMLNIAYLGWGASLADPAGLLRAAAWRELAGLVGVVVASLLPVWLLARPNPVPGLVWYCSLFGVLLATAVWLLIRHAPGRVASRTVIADRWQPFRLPGFRRLLLPYLLNALSVAIPATLALYFIDDRLQGAAWSGVFLGCYFAAAMAGLPLWLALARRWGTLCTWRLGMLLALLAFCGASWLGAGDLVGYGMVCVAAGLALGADLVLPPVLLAQTIPANQPTAAFYGIWTLLGKLALALAGLTLPLLGALGYQPGLGQGLAALSILYAIVPCVCKLGALLLLRRISEPEALS
ncbi:MFS transporter [Leeia oryzae]|uniref:MFS transporter n=1 Tax=Leeia oryzae TaxID=356662 RepID=UPI00037015A3|nr:MFS transporter [Leeia oryzae]